MDQRSNIYMEENVRNKIAQAFFFDAFDTFCIVYCFSFIIVIIFSRKTCDLLYVLRTVELAKIRWSLSSELLF